jgi:hypothetical protein
MRLAVPVRAAAVTTLDLLMTVQSANSISLHRRRAPGAMKIHGTARTRPRPPQNSVMSHQVEYTSPQKSYVAKQVKFLFPQTLAAGSDEWMYRESSSAELVRAA